MARKRKEETLGKDCKITKSITQKEMAQLIWKELNYAISIAEIEEIMRLEKSNTVALLKQGYRIVMRDHLTINSKLKEAKSHVSALDGKTYQIPKRMEVRVTLGRGLKRALILEGN